MNNSTMNDENPAAKPPPLPVDETATNSQPCRYHEEHSLASLLKTPAAILWRIRENDRLPSLSAQLLSWGLIFHAVYGFAMALFDSTEAGAITAVKAPLIAMFSVLLCLPSLYVFSCVAGLPVRITQACALAASTVAMTGLLLLGMTPVTWLFSVSTNSISFVVIMNLISWMVAVGFALRFFANLDLSGKKEKLSGLKWWLFIYITVSLQMATTLRPLLGKPEIGWITPEKKFFLTHFRESISATPRDSATQQKGKR